MPYVNIKLTGDCEAPTPEQKEQLIAGVTKLIADVLGKEGLTPENKTGDPKRPPVGKE